MLKKLGTLTQKLSPSLRKIIGNTAWLIADRILRMGLGLFVGVWVARYLQPEQFGLYNYVIAFASMFDTAANLGLNQIVVRNLVGDPLRKNEVLGTAFLLKLVAQIVALVSAVGIIYLLRSNNSITHWLVGIIAAGMIFNACDVIDFWFQSQVQSKYTVIAKNLGFIVASLGRVLLIQLRAPLIFFAWIGSAEIAFAAVGLVIAYQVKGHLIRAWQYSFSYAKELLKDSWTLTLSSIVIMLYMRIDQIMIGQLVGDQEVGIYSAAIKISEMWYFVPIAITNSIYPLIIEAKKVSKDLYLGQFQKVFNSMAVLSYIVAIAITLLSSQIILLIYGKNYAEAASILTIHIWTGVFVSSGVAVSLWTTTEGLMTFAFAATAIGAVINIILNYFLIRMYGGVGAAISTVVAQLFAAYGAYAFFPRTREIFIIQTKAILMISPIKVVFNKIKKL
jgi:PST family polysaccharide transporter